MSGRLLFGEPCSWRISSSELARFLLAGAVQATIHGPLSGMLAHISLVEGGSLAAMAFMKLVQQAWHVVCRQAGVATERNSVGGLRAFLAACCRNSGD